MLEFLRSRQWIIGRRLALAGIILVLALRQYVGNIVTLFRRPHPERDITITRRNFVRCRERAVWIIGFRNGSDKPTIN
jgi:hypothetical protein